MLRRTCGTFQGDPATVSALLGVPRILDALRAHYGGVPSSPDAGRPACGGGLQPAELRALRQGLLNVALSLLAAQSVPLPQGAAHPRRGHAGKALCSVLL